MTARVEAMELLSRSGWTLERVGEAFGLTRERVRQLIAHIPAEDRGENLMAAGRKATRKEQRIHNFSKRSRRAYGCDFATLKQINGDGPLTRTGCATYLYKQQKVNAITRRIPWKLTLPEWWTVWEASGKWELRGRGKGKYCMSRKGDTGPYAVGNVEIITCQQNSSDHYKYVNKKKRDELGLTPREREVHDLTQLGFTPKAIAAQLGIKTNGIYCMRGNITRHMQLRAAA